MCILKELKFPGVCCPSCAGSFGFSIPWKTLHFPEVQVGSLFLCPQQWRQLRSFVLLVQVPALHQRTEPSCAELLAVREQAGLESVKNK